MASGSTLFSPTLGDDSSNFSSLNNDPKWIDATRLCPTQVPALRIHYFLCLTSFDLSKFIVRFHPWYINKYDEIPIYSIHLVLLLSWPIIHSQVDRLICFLQRKVTNGGISWETRNEFFHCQKSFYFYSRLKYYEKIVSSDGDFLCQIRLVYLLVTHA